MSDEATTSVVTVEQTAGEVDARAIERLLRIAANPAAFEQIFWMDGLLTAAAIGPKQTTGEDWMAAYMLAAPGSVGEFDSASYHELALVFKIRHQRLLAEVRRARHDFEPDFLADAIDDDMTVQRARTWAAGFYRGIHLVSGSWSDISQSDEALEALSVLSRFMERDGQPVMRRQSAQELQEKRVEALPWLGEAVYDLYRFWHSRDGGGRHATRPSVKLGRNATCLCGSGKKFKHCCMN